MSNFTISTIVSAYTKAQVDYVQCFIALYISYNTWYHEVTETTNDRRALTLLKKRYIIWDDYREGKVLRALRPYMEQLVECTTREPLHSQAKAWNGEVAHQNDWHSLIEYWYQVRCQLVHGSTMLAVYVWLAYHTLNVFMEEIVRRMMTQKVATPHVDMQRV